MKKYLADILTLIRFILAVVLIFLGIFKSSVGAGLIVFALAELTDAFDGTCSRKWPFPKGKEPKYRKYAVKYDMWADALLWFAAVLFFTLRVHLVFGLALMIATALICLIIELIVYGKLFGHPDDCAPNSLCRKNFEFAKGMVMGRRWYYLFTIIIMVIWMLVAAEWPTPTKIIITVIGIIVAIFLWSFLKQRRQHISRNAVKLEKDLAKKAQK